MSEPVRYPAARRDDVVDDYHGVRVADPFRWLELADRPDTAAWVAAQNELTASMLATAERPAIRARLEELYNFARTSAPERRGARLFFTHNDGLRNQPVLYVQDGEAPARVLLDPNTLSADGTVALTAVSPSGDGRWLAYALSRNGSDWQEVRVLDAATGQRAADDVRWAKFASLAWRGDGSGFYYTRYPAPGSVPDGDEHYHARIYLHRIGEPQESDTLVFERPDDKTVVLDATVSSDGRWLVIGAFLGSSDEGEVFAQDLALPPHAPVPLFTGFRAAYHFVDAIGNALVFRTTSRAPLGRLIVIDTSHGLPSTLVDGEAPHTVVVGEQPDNLTGAAVAGGLLVAQYLHDASDRLCLFTGDGREAGSVALPAIGSIAAIEARADARDVFLRFSSFTWPPTVLRFDLSTRTVAPWRPHLAPSSEHPAPAHPRTCAPAHPRTCAPAHLRTCAPAHPRTCAPAHPRTCAPAHPVPDSYSVSQVWYPSRDGTKVSMFLVHRADTPRDGRRPVLLTGYGGFNISLTPQYDPASFVWLDRGGVIAVANLRGGGEYGEAWHRAGMFEKKQTVFDDCIAATEWLAASGWSRPDRIAIEGGSNGGLLVGAVLVQRPDSIGAVVCRVPVADMLRYHRFTVGRFWISEYGSADDPVQFPYLYAYSPLHNVRDGVRYPPTLITTADTDDRVAPGMAKKFAARLQEAVAGVDGAGPILLRVETKAGHGAGKPVSKVIDEEADIFAFLFRVMGM